MKCQYSCLCGKLRAILSVLVFVMSRSRDVHGVLL